MTSHRSSGIILGSAHLRAASRGRAAWTAALAASLLLVSGCGSVPGDPLATVSEAINVCDETVPDNRFVDGLPAYAQCDATTGSIWSNNGIDTATSSQGSDWVRTQQGGGYQCTEWAWRYMHFRWNIDYRHGDAREWCDGMLPSTLAKSTTPVHGDLIVFDGGVCGADATTGHIAVVDTVDDEKAKVTIVEENRAGRRASDQSCATCFLHAVANDGSMSGGAGAGGSATAGAGNAGAAAGGGASAAGGRTGGAGRGAGGSSAVAGSGGSDAGSGGSGAAGSDGGGGSAGRGVGEGGSGGGAAGRMGSDSGSAGMPATGSAGQTASGAGQGGTGAATNSGAGASSVAGRGAGTDDGTPGSDLALTETNDGGGCSVRPGRSNGSAWVLFVALTLSAQARRRRSRSRAW
ncbi:MAG TPA: CHAP domain-containing protein [Polyangiaceae bacterium]|nr:CHAP domain-containing protein [Polyangiaceae bacterium]